MKALMDKNLERELIKVEEMIGFYASRVITHPLVPPEHVYFSLTNRCCLSCIMCDIRKFPSRQEDELSTEQVKKIILQIKNLGVKHLIFSGGEPLLREDLVELVRFSTENGIPWVDVITNGVLCDDHIVQELIRAGLNHVTVSLDGVDQVHDAIRGQGAFEKSAQAIDKFNYYKQKLCVTHPTVGINFTILNQNITDMLKIVEFAKEKKCNTVVFQPVLVSNMCMHKRRKNALWPSEAELLALEENIRALLSMKQKEQDVLIYTDSSILKSVPAYFRGKRPGKNFKCYEAIKRIVITCDGKLWSCKGIYGDLKKENLSQAWFSAQARKIRAIVHKCKAHCLQDCVYFPLDIAGKVRHFLGQTKGGPNDNIIRQRLAARIDSCVKELRLRWRQDFWGIFSQKKAEIRKLEALKKEILKNGQT